METDYDVSSTMDKHLETIANGIIDTESKDAIEKFKHNLEVLIKHTKEKKKIDRFALIREDDQLPEDWVWRVSSKNTSMESVVLGLSYNLRKKYALEKAGIKSTINGISIPVSEALEKDALSKVDKKLGSVLLPSIFRSTKHFTVNTPLGVTGDYNSVSTDRNFIVIDTMDKFLASDYAYSLSHHDAYLDVTHEGLEVSENAVVLIPKDRYEKLLENPETRDLLQKRKVILFTGDESVAIDMVLTQLGVLPTQVGLNYAIYDAELQEIITKSIRDLAGDNGLLYDKSHSGALTPEGGHFSNYYDELNRDYEASIEELVEFLKLKFPKYEQYFTINTVAKGSFRENIIEEIGVENMLNAINEYNEQAKAKFQERKERYKRDRSKVTREVHDVFVRTLNTISAYYNSGANLEMPSIEIENRIREFLHSDSVESQLEAAKRVIGIIGSKEFDNSDIQKSI